MEAGWVGRGARGEARARQSGGQSSDQQNKAPRFPRPGRVTLAKSLNIFELHLLTGN